jgi:hypothetical protein
MKRPPGEPGKPDWFGMVRDVKAGNLKNPDDNSNFIAILR